MTSGLSLLTNSITRLTLSASRSLHLTRCVLSDDLRDKRAGALKKTDKVEGEHGTYDASPASFDYIDENVLDKVIDNVKFRNIPVMHVICTKNNTKISIRTQDDTILVKKSAGSEGYKNCRKGTTVAAQAVAKRVLTYAKDHDINMVRLLFNGLGPGRNAAFKTIELSGLKVVSLSDRTQAAEPWNLRPRHARRV